MKKPIDNYDSAVKRAQKLIKEFEGLRLKPYLCPGGYMTIGWGHRIRNENYEEITPEEAELLLVKDISGVIDALEGMLGDSFEKLTDNQKAALISFVYNIGENAFRKSTIRKKILGGAPKEEIAEEFKKWVFAGGKKLKGLEKRREKEAELFLED